MQNQTTHHFPLHHAAPISLLIPLCCYRPLIQKRPSLLLQPTPTQNYHFYNYLWLFHHHPFFHCHYPSLLLLSSIFVIIVTNCYHCCTPFLLPSSIASSSSSYPKPPPHQKTINPSCDKRKTDQKCHARETVGAIRDTKAITSFFLHLETSTKKAKNVNISNNILIKKDYVKKQLTIIVDPGMDSW